MRKIWLVASAAVLWSTSMLCAAADDLSGSWAGPWYRGMTSGTMMLQIDADGAGVVQFRNLDNFGEDEVALSKVKKSGNSLKFSAAGAGAGVFVANTELTSDGKILKGKAEYEGFPIKFKLKRR